MAESENKTAEINEVTELGQTRQGSIHCLSIIGQIEGHQILPEDVKTTKYEHVLPMLAAIEESPEITGLLILLNTVGGDVEAGLAIAELIAGMSTPTVSLVLGGGHSIVPTLDRRPARRLREAQLHCALGINDDTPRAYKWPCHRRAADL